MTSNEARVDSLRFVDSVTLKIRAYELLLNRSDALQILDEIFKLKISHDRELKNFYLHVNDITIVLTADEYLTLAEAGIEERKQKNDR